MVWRAEREFAVRREPVVDALAGPTDAARGRVIVIGSNVEVAGPALGHPVNVPEPHIGPGAPQPARQRGRQYLAARHHVAGPAMPHVTQLLQHGAQHRRHERRPVDAAVGEIAQQSGRIETLAQMHGAAPAQRDLRHPLGEGEIQLQRQQAPCAVFETDLAVDLVELGGETPVPDHHGFGSPVVPEENRIKPAPSSSGRGDGGSRPSGWTAEATCKQEGAASSGLALTTMRAQIVFSVRAAEVSTALRWIGVATPPASQTPRQAIMSRARFEVATATGSCGARPAACNSPASVSASPRQIGVGEGFRPVIERGPVRIGAACLENSSRQRAWNRIFLRHCYSPVEAATPARESLTRVPCPQARGIGPWRTST